MTKPESPVGYKFSILHEDVADQDLLEDQTHFHVSENIYQLIQSSAKGITVGLEGSWGSGKSTVINLLRNKLQDNSEGNCLFFMFDAWAHDGDPLRRIFLESLINEIDPEGADETLRELSGRITGRNKTVKTQSTRSASKFGKLLSVFALTIPLGSALIGKVNYDLLSPPWGQGESTIYWQFIFGLILCLSPFILILWWMKFGERDSNTGKIRWDFFSTESTENSTQDVTEDGERTSIEFEAHFERIIKHAINEKKVDRVVIVIDNLDRVDPPHAKNIWATLQTFFQKRSSGSKSTLEKWADKLWFVIPFDRNGFSKIWESNSLDESKSVPISFLKKCFQIIAEVPEPVMSAWPDYAKKTFATALNEWPEKERQEAIEAFIRFASHLDKSPTPRDIKVLANQVGLLGMRWGGVVSSEALCVYALYRQKLSEAELRNALLADGLPESYAGINDSKILKMEIAGLLFGVTKDKGIQLLLTPEIGAAVKNGDGELLKDLVKKYDEAFWITWRQKRSYFIPNDDHIEELKISATLAICNGLGEFKHQNKLDISLLADLWKSVSAKWVFKDFDYSEAIKSLIENSMDKESLLIWLKQFIETKLKDLVNSTKGSDFAASSLPNFRKLVDVAEFFDVQLKRLHYGQLDAACWGVWNKALDDYDLAFPFVLPAKSVVSELAGNVNFSQPSLSEDSLNILLKTIDIYPFSNDWPKVTDEMIAWSNLPSRQTGYGAFYLLLLRLMATQKNEVAESIKACVKAAPFWVRARLESEEDSTYLSILAAVAFGKELNKSNIVSSDCVNFWAVEKDDAPLNEIYELISENKCLGTIWALSTNPDNKVAIELIRKHSDMELFKSPYGTWYMSEYSWAAESEMEDIVIKLCEGGAVSPALPHMEKHLSAYGTNFKILKNYASSEIKEAVRKIINEISKDQWYEHFSDESDLIYCVDRNNHKYSDALVEYFSRVVSESDFECYLWPNFEMLIEKCCDSQTIAIPKILNSYLESQNDQLDIESLKYLLLTSKNVINNCNKHFLMQKIIKWTNNNEWDKVDLLLSLGLDPIENPLEGLLSRISADINSFPEIIRPTITDLRLLVGYSPEKNIDESDE